MSGGSHDLPLWSYPERFPRYEEVLEEGANELLAKLALT
jgi:hypothetical protein